MFFVRNSVFKTVCYIYIVKGAEMEKAEKNKRIGKIFLILFICLADIGWAAAALYAWKRNGTILSVKTASVDIPGIFVQT